MSEQELREVATWLPVAGYEGRYEVSDRGEVRSLPRARTRGGILKQSLRANGYPFVSLSGKSTSVHTLVAEAFHGPRPPGHVVRHLSGDKRDNRAENLAWGTPSENEADKFTQGLLTLKTHCKQGHPYEGNTIKTQARGRRCGPCNAATTRAWREARRAQQPADAPEGHGDADEAGEVE